MENAQPRTRGVLRKFLVVAKWAIWILVGLCLLLVGINLFDEDLSPEARALLTAPPNPYRPEDNLYLALLGFEAKAGESPIKAGQARVAAYEVEAAAALKDPKRDAPIPDNAWYKRERLQFRGKVGFCSPLLKSCLAGVEAHAGEIGRLLKDNRELYLRYARLRELKGYHETATPSVIVPIGYPPIPVRQLYLANVALRARSGDRLRRNAAIADLLADMRVWRLELTGNSSLISKMIAVANLQGDYALLADIIADSSIVLTDVSSQIQTALESPENDWRIGNAFAHELKVHAHIWNQLIAEVRKQPMWDLSEEGTWWERLGNRASLLFFPLRATLNLEARATTRLRAMADAEPAKFFAARDEYRSWTREHLDLGVRYAYNPMGRLFLAIGADAYEGYPLRSYDGAAFQRMARLGYEIRNRKIDDKAILEFMRLNPQWASHPVDGRAFLWDEKKREITVQTLGQQPKDRRFSIPVWSAAANGDHLPR
jgi:hypothetical protein